MHTSTLFDGRITHRPLSAGLSPYTRLVVWGLTLACVYLTQAYKARAYGYLPDASTKSGLVTSARADITITGTVQSADNENLPGVNILVKGTSNGTVSAADGKFTLTAPEDGTLVVSFIGYATQEVPVNGRRSLTITLRTDAKALDEVVVVGYGAQSRASVTTSITKLDTKVLENIPYTNAASAMQGTLPGVRVQNISGQPGAAPRVIVRGGTSINSPNGASPLYVIDGIIRPDMNDISPDDIASLQVLKDAASTSIYGARGSNGVVIITTKTGRAGKVQIAYNYGLSVAEAGRRYNMANARDLIYYGRLGVKTSLATGKITAAAANAKLTGTNSIGTGNDLTNNTGFTTQYLTDQNRYKLDQGWESMPDPVDPTKTLIFKGTNFENLLFQTAVSHNNYLSLNGGTDKASFNAGIGYLNGQGTAITTKFDRLTFNLNSSLNLRDNLNVYGRVMYTQSGTTGVYDESFLFMRSIGLPASAKYEFEDGTLAPGLQRALGNPVYHLNNRNDKSASDKMTLALGGHWDIGKGLSFDPQVSLYRTNDEIRTFLPAYQNGAGPANLITSRVATNAVNRWNQRQADAVVNYVRDFGGVHNLEAKVGFSYFSRAYNTFNATGQGSSTDLIPTLNASATYTTVSSTISNLLLLGYFGRLNYDYRQKYLLNINARYDGASNLGLANRWGLFPGISAGWNIHNEDFWKSVPAFLTSTKLRASYGVNGNISGISDFQAQGEYGIPSAVTQQRYLGFVGIQQTVLPNSNLQWERSETVDFGADLGLFNNRITVLFDVYRRVTNNLLTNLSLPYSTGFNSIFTNLGSLQNKGVELEIGTQILPNASALSWNFSVNAAYTKQKILKLPPSGAENNRVGGIQIWDPQTQNLVWVPANFGLMEGQQTGNWYGYKALGVYATDEEAKSAPVDNVIGANKTKYAGDIIWQDTDGNGKIEQVDKVYLGNVFPVMTGGFTNTLGYKGLVFTVRMDYALGHSIYNYGRAFLNGNWQGDSGPTQDFLDKAWKQPGDVTDVPRYNPFDASTQQNLWRGQGNTGVSSQYVEKGDYLCVREATLSYNIPSSLLRKIKLTGLRFNLTGSNLHYFTAYQGTNPEDGGFSTAPSQWGDRGRYPIPRTITLGAHLTL